MKTFKGFFKAFVLIAGFVAIFFFRDEATTLLLNARGFLQGLIKAENARTLADLRTENASLKKELEKSVSVTRGRAQFLEARIYSRYPFNDKNIIVIDKGSDDGIVEGMPVLVKNNVLLGQVRKVKRFESEVTTIFDPGWKSSVLVGKSHIKSVLHGANAPQAELIPKDATLSVGDEVINGAQEFPLGLFVGTVASVTQDEKKIWQIATLDVPYAMEDIDTVLVMTNFR